MRILIANDDAQYDHLSVPGIAYRHALFLADSGHQVTLVGTLPSKAPTPSRSPHPNLRLVTWRTRVPARFRAWLGLWNPPIVARFRCLLDQFRPDIVHFHNVHSALSFACLRQSLLRGIPSYLTAHDVMLFWARKLAVFDAATRPSDFLDNRIDYRRSLLQRLRHQRLRYMPLRNTLVRRWLSHPDCHLITVSEELAKALRANGFRPQCTIHNGVDAEAMTVDEGHMDAFCQRFHLGGKKCILFGGRLGDLKGGSQLLRALGSLNRDDWRLVVIGGNEENIQRLKRQARYHGVTTEQLVFTGWLSGKDLAAAFRCSDLCANPSLCFETFSMFNIEAMLAAKPLISSFFGGPLETVVDGVTGFLRNPFRTQEWTECVAYLLDHPDVCREVGERGREHVLRHFDLERKMRSVLELYVQARALTDRSKASQDLA